MPPLHPALLEHFGYALYRSGLHFRSLLVEALEEDKLVPPQIAILTVLSHSTSINQLQLGEELGIDRASMVKLIDGLEAQGLVERRPDANDRRARLLSVTDKGRLQYETLRRKELAVETQFLAPLDEAEREILRKLVFKIATQIGSTKP